MSSGAQYRLACNRW